MRKLQIDNKLLSTNLLNKIGAWITRPFLAFDKKVDGALSFFFKHYGKTKFMIAMSKKVQVLGLERLFNAGPKAFFYFFMFYLIRDTILYILIPIYLAKLSGQ